MRILLAAFICAIAASPASANTLSPAELQALVRSTAPAPQAPSSAIGIGYNSFAQKDVSVCYDPPITRDVTTAMGARFSLAYASTRDELFRAMRLGPGMSMGLGPNAATAATTIARERFGPYHRFVVLNVTVRGKGSRFARNHGFVDGVPSQTARAEFFARCGDKFAREVYPTASLTIVYGFTLKDEQDTVAMDLRAEGKTGDLPDGAALVAALRTIADKTPWRAAADTVGFNRTLPAADFDKLALIAENFPAMVDKCRAAAEVTCTDDTGNIDAAHDGMPPPNSFFVTAATEYDDYRDELGIFDATPEWFSIRELSDRYTRLLEIRDAGTIAFQNVERNFWPALPANEHDLYEKSLDDGLAALRTSANGCAATLGGCTPIDLAAIDRLMENNPLGERYGVVVITDIPPDRQNQAIGYIGDGSIGLVDFLGTLSAPLNAPYRDARDTNLVELRMRNTTGAVDPNAIRYTGQTCIKGPATVLYWPVGKFDYQYYVGRAFKGRIWIVDAKEEANLPKGTECYAPAVK